MPVCVLQAEPLMVKDGFVKVPSVGAGFLMVRRDVIIQMIESYRSVVAETGLSRDKSTIRRYTYALIWWYLEWRVAAA